MPRSSLLARLLRVIEMTLRAMAVHVRATSTLTIAESSA
jgi:hypothetical protein